ncbi:MAG: V-type ATP synthase subunit I, partial [Pirellulaceae bacterium]|nr:V-type ATP synthase subunit I [Pirellulaceae bacterium]
MAIVPLNKVTFFGSTAQCERVIDRLQDLGCAHLRNLADPDRGEQAEEGRDTAAHEALKFLRSCRQHRRQVRRERFDRQAVVREALGIQARQQELLDERDGLGKAIDDLEPWGDFELPADGRIAGQRLWFFVIPLRDLRQFYAQPPAAWHEVTRDHREARLVVIQAEEPRGLPGTRVELDGRSLSRLRAAVEEAEEELAALHYQRIGLTRFCELLASDLARADDA